MLKSILLVLLLPLPQDEMSIQKHEELKGAHPSPVIYSSDGKSLFYIEKDEDGKFAYMSADVKGGNVKKIYATPVDWDDVWNGSFTPASVSSDGSRVTINYNTGIPGDKRSAWTWGQTGIVFRYGLLCSRMLRIPPF